jgi:hypothetical protein
LKTLALLLSLASSVASAQIIMRQGQGTSFPTREIDCGADGGLLCIKGGATATSTLKCNGATVTEAGCVTPNAQSYAGNKTFTGNIKAVIVDAGIGAIGSIDIRGSAIGNTGASSTFLLASNTSDGSTSSTAAALTLQCTAALTSSNLCFDLQDNSGAHLMSMSAGGALHLSGIAKGSLPACTAGLKYAVQPTTDTNELNVCDGTTWQQVLTGNPDGGAPWGPVFEVSGFQPSNSKTAIRQFKTTMLNPKSRALTATYSATTGGLGVGTHFWLNLFEPDAGISLCDAGFDCGLSGTLSQYAICPKVSMAHTNDIVEMRIDCTECDVTGCPIGTGTFQMQSIPGQ